MFPLLDLVLRKSRADLLKVTPFPIRTAIRVKAVNDVFKEWGPDPRLPCRSSHGSDGIIQFMAFDAMNGSCRNIQSLNEFACDFRVVAAFFATEQIGPSHD